MSRPLGGYTGFTPTPTSSVASGIWTVRDAERYKKSGAWPIPSPSDPLFSNVQLLLHMDGSNGSTIFTDSSSTPKTVTRNGTPIISTAGYYFGGASGVFGGSSDYLTVADSNMAVGSGDFTIECFIYLISLQSGIRTLWAHRSSGDAVGGASLTHTNGSIRLYIAGYNPYWEVLDFSPGLTFLLNTWHHVALVRDGNTIRTFLDGQAGSTTSVSTGAISTSDSFSIMAGSAVGGQEVNGYLDEFRLTKAARYQSSFDPPTAPFPNS